MQKAAIGFRAKTGRAIAVVLSDAKQFIAREEISLVDPLVPATGQPYHEVMELPWPEAVVAATPYVRAIELVATRAVSRMIDVLRERGLRVASVAVVGSIERSLERIGNPHIRAHAAEGILFRRVLEVAAAAHRLQVRAFTEVEIKQQKLARQLGAFGKQAGPPWRADEKAAATAAWMMLDRR